MVRSTLLRRSLLPAIMLLFTPPRDDHVFGRRLVVEGIFRLGLRVDGLREESTFLVDLSKPWTVFHDDAEGALPQPWTGETLLEVVDEVNDLDRRPRMRGDAWVAETTSLRRAHHRYRQELYEPDFPGADQALERFRVTICTYEDGTSETIVDNWLASRDGGQATAVGGPGPLPRDGGSSAPSSSDVVPQRPRARWTGYTLFFWKERQ